MVHKSFDLTTQAGATKAKGWLEDMDSLDVALWATFGPLAVLGRRLIQRSTDPTAELKQAKSLIEAGRRNGVDEMEIKVSKQAGAKLKAQVPDANVNIEGGLGVENEVTVKVKYK